MSVRFGEYVFDAESHRLLRGNEEVRLTPKAWELLHLLVRVRPRAVSKTEIRGRLWPDTHVGAGSLTVLVAELRGALGDDAREPRHIRTVFGHGYAFAGEAADDPPAAAGPGNGSAPRIIWGRRVLPLAEGDNVLGRDEDVAIHIDDASVSRHHAVVHVRGDEVTIEDLGSKNGTYVKDTRVEREVRLADGETFAVGELALVLRTGPLPGPTATAARDRT
jgi:DNA-binding winged helix-turn-helix (wHTH) protein